MKHQAAKKRDKKMAYAKDNPQPSKELIDKVRTILLCQTAFSSQMQKSLKEEGLLRSYLGEQLRSLLNQLHLDIQVSMRATVPGVFGKKFKVIHKVAEKGVVRLEFTYLIEGTNENASRALESVSRYQPGEWEQKIDTACSKCLDIFSQWEQVNSLVKELSTAPHSAGEIIEIVEATKDPAETIKLLALSNRETMCEPLFLVCLSIGKIKQAQRVIETLVQIYSKEAIYHLTLGNMFFMALYNDPRTHKPPPGIDPTAELRHLIETSGAAGAKFLDSLRHTDPYSYKSLTGSEYKPPRRMQDWAKQITLEALGCNYEFARKAAEEHFGEAMRLSRDEALRELAKQALVTLRIMDKLGGG